MDEREKKLNDLLDDLNDKLDKALALKAEQQMGMTIDDNVKKQIIDKLLEEPPMVLSTAYVYAKNYVDYGEDVTKAWTTAVQQASVIQEVRQKAWVEAYDSFKADYEARLKADMVAMLTDIQLEIEEKASAEGDWIFAEGERVGSKLIQQKIDALKTESEGKE